MEDKITANKLVKRHCPKCGAEMYDLKDGDWDCPRCEEIILSNKQESSHRKAKTDYFKGGM